MISKRVLLTKDLCSSQVHHLPSRLRAVVVGAGPAGATAAIYLARRGYSVEVFERRPEPKGDQVRVSAYSLSLLQVGLLTPGSSKRLLAL